MLTKSTFRTYSLSILMSTGRKNFSNLARQENKNRIVLAKSFGIPIVVNAVGGPDIQCASVFYRNIARYIDYCIDRGSNTVRNNEPRGIFLRSQL